MAIQIQNLDLEEQEQLDKLKAFWETWGNLISGILIVVLLGFSAWRGYDWYTARQAQQAAPLYDQVAADAMAGDTAKLASSLKLIQDSYGKTVYAQQAGLLAAKVFFEKNQLEQSRAALAVVAGTSTDKGLQSLARLQLAQQLAQQKQYDQAAQQLSSGMAPGFEALAADGLGDIYNLQGKSAEAVSAYTKAYKGLEPGQPYRAMVGMKLGALGVDASALNPATPATAASGAAAVAPAQVASAASKG